MTLRNSVVPVTAATLTGMTPNQVAFGNSTGGLQGSANLTFDGSTLTLTGAQSISGQLTSTVATGTAPFVVASTTVVGNLNVSQLLGATWASPGAIGSTARNSGAFTTLAANGAVTFTATTASSSTSTGAVVIGNGSSGGLGVGGNVYVGGALTVTSTSSVSSIANILTLGPSSGGASSATILALTNNGGTAIQLQDNRGVIPNWLIGSQYNIDHGLEFTPSTANGSTTYSTPILVIKGAGRVIVNNGTTDDGVNALQVGGATSLLGALTVAGGIRSNTATSGIGYATGAGGTVTQATSKSTGVTLNTVCGTITMNGAALASATSVAFTLTDSAIAATDVVVCVHDSVGTLGGYGITVTPAAGSATITVRNNTAGALSEAIVLRFAIIKAVTA